MITVPVAASRPYTVMIGSDCLHTFGHALHEALPKAKKIALCSDDTVFSLYGQAVTQILTEAGFTVLSHCIRPGECSKNLDTVGELLSFLADARITRTDAIVALGGGVVGDVTGLCAALLRRGVPYAHVPTTLLACVDSSVGGKTAVDLPQGKNLVGAFYPPSLVFCDTACLATLPERERDAGFAEVVKYGVLFDGGFFAALEADTLPLSDVIGRCVTFKRDVVQTDEFDTGIRNLLNFGHTFAHAYEVHSNYALRHGEAVAAGMVSASRLAEAHGIAREPVSERLCALLTRHRLPTDYDIPQKALLSLMADDKKADGDTLTLILPQRIGGCVRYPVKLTDLPDFLAIRR